MGEKTIELRANKPVIRQSRSCKVCRLRKVRCDRVKPCQACCAHGHPSKCVYEPIADDDLRPVSQAEEIRNLRAEIKKLRAKISGKGSNRASRIRRLAQLERLFESIRAAPLDVVDDIVEGIRATGDNGKKALLTFGPWEGHEAYERSQSLVHRPRRSLGNENSEENSEPGSSDSYLYRRGHAVNPFLVQDGDLYTPLVESVSSFTSSRLALDVFVERFVDAFSPEVDFKAGHAGAIRAAAQIRMFSPLMCDAFEAVSVAFFGRSIQDKRIETVGFRMYPRVLRGLQEALMDAERSKAESTLVTVILLIAFESVERTTQASVATHVLGALRLIEHRGPENHMYGVEHSLFVEMRPYWVAGSFFTRKPTFFARPEWKTIPWSANTTAKDLLHYLLDLAVEIPGLMAQYDEVQAAERSGAWSTVELTAKRATLWNAVTGLTQQYVQWKKDWVDMSPDGPPRETTGSQGEGFFPVFQCRNLRTGALYQPSTFLYPNLRLAQSMCLYYTTRLVLSSVDNRPDGVRPPEQYALACDICRSLEWYIRKAPGNMINRLAFTVRVAWEAFTPGGPERGYLTEVLQLVEKRHSLALWGSAMPELSVAASRE
ncbi:hypothetical protein ASPZODRAFT_2117719 [Penicilliopsis zonata CBS 506.65]|uniref:Zn(2)-C6 fungal-type domain-containing protein n=1 Tax=Penicilliopsis zonata CBS 506.65 TaxID=1073090 RepID=A0A1L9STH3_9EURO|nr:hypothetical protein ASPZODRAFT_2117719 [Penicilliopsis zonata CBS 506.65]OJJ50383.1 hypothetical protein ASPZODRAFT_2117719 [Penicilliopsis zonata CBS 506.65]